jgi:DNA-binding IclR family transcriptional regulator
MAGTVNREEREPPAQTKRAGIQSVDAAVPLLRVLAAAQAPMQLAALAQAAGMPRSKAHKYLVSLSRNGLVSQSGAGGRYGLGPFALELGLAAMRGLDVMQYAQQALEELRDELETTTSVAVWTNRGPAIVRWAPTPYIIDSMRLGTVFPMLTSSFGRVFAAHLDRRYTEPLIAAELAAGKSRGRDGLRNQADVEAMLETVRRQGLAIVHSAVAPGFDAISAPVFDHSDGIIAALAVVGIHGEFRTARTGRAARAIVAAAARLSQRLGASGPGKGAPGKSGRAKRY